MSQEERMKRMREAGIPMPVTQMNEGSGGIPVTSSNAGRHEKLMALKRGANRDSVKELVGAKSTQNSFNAIPENRNRRQNPNNTVTPGKSIQLAKFETQKSSEFDSMESMYGGNDKSYSQPATNMYSNNTGNMDNYQPDLTIPNEGVGPIFDPLAMLAKKRASATTQEVPAQHQSEYTKYAVTEQNLQQNSQQQSFDFQYLKEMMKEIATNTISEVLNNYTEKNKTKSMYENYTKTKEGNQVVKTQDGKLFKLVPVQIKK